MVEMMVVTLLAVGTLLVVPVVVGQLLPQQLMG